MLVLIRKLAYVVLPVLLMVGCGSSSHDDLQAFIDENKRRPPGTCLLYTSPSPRDRG